jgi:hypothetical protein
MSAKETAMATTTSGGRPRRPDLLLSVIALIALVIACLLVTAFADTTWTLALALVSFAAATLGIVLVTRRLLSDEDDASAGRAVPRSALVLGAVAVATLGVAAALDRGDAASRSTDSAQAGGAAQTLRDFLVNGVVDDNAYVACQYLTPGEQQHLARVAGQGQTCRDALTATPPSLPGVSTGGRIRRLHMRTVVRGGQARIAVSGTGSTSLTFTLRRATPAELGDFEAPPAAWRIESGATALLGTPAANRGR